MTELQKILRSRLKGIHSRCFHVGNDDYKYYGAKGIGVCDTWRGEGSIASFEHWAMNNGFSPELVIDRVDPDGDYGPENCRWISPEENSARARPKAVFTSQKLTAEKVSRIKKLYKRGTYGYQRIGNEYGIDRTTVREIIRGEIWKHV